MLNSCSRVKVKGLRLLVSLVIVVGKGIVATKARRHEGDCCAPGFFFVISLRLCGKRRELDVSGSWKLVFGWTNEHPRIMLMIRREPSSHMPRNVCQLYTYIHIHFIYLMYLFMDCLTAPATHTKSPFHP